MIQKIIILANAVFDMLLLFGFYYFVDEYCTNITLITFILQILKIFEPIFGKLKCSLLLKPLQISTTFGYLSNQFSSKIPITFTLNLIIRLLSLMFIALNPWAFFLATKLLTLLNYIGIFIISYYAVELSWKPGIYFQYNLQHAMTISIPIIIFFIFSFITSTSTISKFAILLPFIQFLITSNGSLITSLLVGIIILQESIYFHFLLSLGLVAYLLFTKDNNYQYLAIGQIVSNSIDITNNWISFFFIVATYIYTLVKSRNKISKQN